MESSRGAPPPASSDDASGGGGGAGGRLFPCLFCNRTFLKWQALGGHQNAHKKERAVGGMDPYCDSSYASGIELEARAAGGGSALAVTSSTLVAGSSHCGAAVAGGAGVSRSREVPHRHCAVPVPAAAMRSEVERWSGQHAPAHHPGDSVIDVDMLNWTRSSALAPTEEAYNSKGTTEEPDLELRL